MTTEPYRFNRFYQTMIEGVQEIIGLPDLKKVESVRATQELGVSAGAEEKMLFYQFASWMAALEQVFGRRSGQGIALRGGRVSFLYLSRLPDLWDAFSHLAKQLLPAQARIKGGLEILAETVTRECGVQVQVTEDPQNWYWQIAPCPWCSGRTEDTSACQFMIGLLQEFTSWMSGGRYYDVSEVECCAAEAEACLIQIGKQSMD
ncbi:MAG: hypothetical protein HPY59_13155 [Anaerolineae bacterium]|nr:hypothetical protein [Anaerolineae bacterium]